MAEKNRKEIIGTHVQKSRRQQKNYYTSLKSGNSEKISPTVKNENRIIDEPEPEVIKKERNPARPKRPKSFHESWVEFKDKYLKDIFVGSIFTLVIGGMLFGYVIPNNREIGQLQSDIKYLSEDITRLQEKYKEDMQANHTILKLEIQKDLDLIKQRLDTLELRSR